MFGSRGDFGVDQASGSELGSGFLSCAFECELWELGKGRVWGYGAMVEIGGGVVDCCEDKVIWLWNILCIHRR